MNIYSATPPGLPLAPSALPAAQRIAALARVRGEELDQDGAFPDQEIAALARAGLLTAPLPVELGGTGLGQGQAGTAELAEVLMALGAGSLPLGRVYEGHVNALGLILAYGDAAQRQQAMRDAAAGCLFGVWNTDDRQDPLRLDSSSSTCLLRGRKILASGAGWVERPLVTVATPTGTVMMVPPLGCGERADLADWQPQGMRASATGAVSFEGLPAPPAIQIGLPGDYQRQPAFSSGAWRFLAVQTGGVAELFALLCHHLRTLQRDGDPHQRARVGEAATALESARLWVRSAAVHAVDLQAAAEDVVAYVNLARGAVERAALEVLSHAQRSVGLAGFMRPHPLERVSRDLATYLRQPAPDRALEMGAAHVLAQETWPWA